MSPAVVDAPAWAALAIGVAWFVFGLHRVQGSQSMGKQILPSALIAWAALTWLIASNPS